MIKFLNNCKELILGPFQAILRVAFFHKKQPQQLLIQGKILSYKKSRKSFEQLLRKTKHRHIYQQKNGQKNKWKDGWKEGQTKRTNFIESLLPGPGYKSANPTGLQVRQYHKLLESNQDKTAVKILTDPAKFQNNYISKIQKSKIRNIQC